jgi:hypothetical protein
VNISIELHEKIISSHIFTYFINFTTRIEMEDVVVEEEDVMEAVVEEAVDVVVEEEDVMEDVEE